VGVPIDAFLFGGRRSSVVPLVREAFDWKHGVFLGATMASEKTAAAAGNVGELRFDPMAMLPFCGYNMGDYFRHWIEIARRKDAKLPRVFYVNWFRKGEDGSFLWPGYGENSRVLEWVFRRCEGTAEGETTPIGCIPTADALNLDGLDIDPDDFEQVRTVDLSALSGELPQVRQHLERFGDSLPDEVWAEFDALEERLGATPA
jgi:phosphoenolpyruvate carboxykinase (GTP)